MVTVKGPLKKGSYFIDYICVHGPGLCAVMFAVCVLRVEGQEVCVCFVVFNMT